MSPIEFKNRYLASLPSVPSGLNLGLDEFVRCPPLRPGLSSLSVDDRDHLVEIGLPRDAPPFLSFRPLGANADGGDDPQSLFLLGSDGSGDCIYIDHESGKVVIVDHERPSKRMVVNSSFSRFVECLCVFREYLRKGAFVGAGEAMVKIDPLAADGFWPVALAAEEGT